MTKIMAKSQLDENGTEEQIRGFVGFLASLTVYAHMYVTPFDKLFMNMTHTLVPPSGPIEELTDEVLLVLMEKPI